MYKNFYLTESERERILGMHKEHGYKKAINEQESFDGEMDGLEEPRGSINDVMDFVYDYISKKAPNGPGDKVAYIDAIDELKSEFDYAIRNIQDNFSSDSLNEDESRGSINDVMDFVYDYMSKKAPNGPGDKSAYIGAIYELKREFHYAIRNVQKNINSNPLSESWREVFGTPDAIEAAKSAYKSQGHSMVGSDDEERTGEYYTVFNGQKFFPDQIDYADYHDLGELPRVENGILIVPNPAWQS
jgi:hypothetical protein